MDLSKSKKYLICIDRKLTNLTLNKRYKMLAETPTHYNLKDDKENDVLVGKSSMQEIEIN